MATDMNKADSRASLKRHAVAMAIIVVAGVAAYCNSTGGSFHFDDFPCIVSNPSIRSINPARVWNGNDHFRFISFYSFALNYGCNGLSDMRGWHYVNIGLHLVCAVLLYLVLSLLAGKRSAIPLMAALLFAVHPLFSEPVNYIQSRQVILYTIFSLTGVLSAIYFLNARDGRDRMLALLAIAASLILGGLCKEVGIFYVAAGVGVCVFAFRSGRGRGLKIIALILAISAAAIVLVLFVQGYMPVFFQPRNITAAGETTFSSRVLTEGKVFWKYVALVVPSSRRLNVDHHVAIVRPDSPGQALIAAIPLMGILAVFVIGVRARRRSPLVSFLLLWVVAGIIPYLPLVGTDEIMVEYKFYLPGIGLAGLAAWIAERVYLAAGREVRLPYGGAVCKAIFAFFILYCILETRERNRVWADDITLWSDASRKSPASVRPYNNLGIALADRGMFTEAIEQFSKALRLAPDDSESHSNLGLALAEQGRVDEAVYHCGEAIRLKPDSAEVRNGLGTVLAGEEKWEQAASSYREALKLKPDYAEAHNNLGIALLKQGNVDEAIAQYEEALARNPDFPEAHLNAALAYAQKGMPEQAIRHYSELIRIKPDDASAHVAIGNILFAQRRLDEAIDHYTRALRIDPDDAFAHNNLGSALANEGIFSEAIAHFSEAVRIKPDFADARANLEMAQKKGGEAMR